MSIKNSMRQHFVAQREWLSLEVPEWGETIWFRKMNLSQEAAIANAQSKGDGSWIARILIELAHNEQKIPIFSEQDWKLLTEEADPVVVCRVGEEIARALEAKKESEAKKPSQATDSSAPPSTSQSQAITP